MLATEQKLYDIHISSQLRLIRSPVGMCAAWLNVESVWYRRLNSGVFVWLRQKVNEAIESSSLSDSFTDAVERLREIERIGLEHGCFTAAEVSPFVEPPEDFVWYADVPLWAEDF